MTSQTWQPQGLSLLCGVSCYFFLQSSIWVLLQLPLQFYICMSIQCQSLIHVCYTLMPYINYGQSQTHLRSTTKLSPMLHVLVYSVYMHYWHLNSKKRENTEHTVRFIHSWGYMFFLGYVKQFFAHKSLCIPRVTLPVFSMPCPWFVLLLMLQQDLCFHRCLFYHSIQKEGVSRKHLLQLQTLERSHYGTTKLQGERANHISFLKKYH